ncbi:MAG TPA: hypothetical protein VFH83_05600, partial [Spirochaetia bacterium]|nr:hypothetical protein [Spirochaetia bacterium]
MKSSRFRLLGRLGEQVRRLRLERWTVISVTVAFAAALAIVLISTQSQSFSLGRGAASWEAGAVADMDYVVERDFQYVDDKATQAKRDAREKLVPPVYTINSVVTAATLDTFDRFTQTVTRLIRQGTTEDKL